MARLVLVACIPMVTTHSSGLRPTCHLIVLLQRMPLDPTLTHSLYSKHQTLATLDLFTTKNRRIKTNENENEN